jgi:hypothetical protein
MRKLTPRLKVYLSGPMRGYVNENQELFAAQAGQLRDRGYEVFDPHELSRALEQELNTSELPFERYLRNDYTYVLQSDALAVLPGWEHSVGAVKEARVARDCDIPVYAVQTLLDYGHPRGVAELIGLESLEPPETVVQEAHRIVHGGRQKEYGHPYDNDRRTAGMLRARFGWDVKVSDVWQIMVIVKLSRETTQPKRDTRVDVAGYAAVGDLVQQRLAEGLPDDPFKYTAT